MVWSAVGRSAGEQVLPPCRQVACRTSCDVVAVQEQLQADVPGIDAIGLTSWFAKGFDAAMQGLGLVWTVPVDGRSNSPKRVP